MKLWQTKVGYAAVSLLRQAPGSIFSLVVNDDIDSGNNGFKLELISKPLVGISSWEKVHWEVKPLLEASLSLVC